MNNLTTPKAIILVGIILSVVYIFFAPRYELQIAPKDQSAYLRLDTRTGEVCVGSVRLDKQLAVMRDKGVKHCK